MDILGRLWRSAYAEPVLRPGDTTIIPYRRPPLTGVDLETYLVRKAKRDIAVRKAHEVLLYRDPLTDAPPQQQPEHDSHGHSMLSYQHVRMLGHGGSGIVEMVRDVNTGSVYARKIIKNVYSHNMEEAKQKLLNEVRIMQRLSSHHHIVSVHATYIEKRELAIILDPVADDGDLTNFLQNYRDQGSSWLGGGTNDANSFQNGILRKSFGCLASALTFIHKQNIRHKDIKPQNVLIHRGSIMYTDFGVSYDFKDSGRSTTTGDPGGISKKYCAPEVADCGSRNTKSDVFSLGCVFVEICLALANERCFDDVYQEPYYRVVRSHLHGLPLPAINFSHEEPPTLHKDIILEMMQENPESRPPASTVVRKLLEYCSDSSRLCPECHAKLQLG